jgi:hypothetical protein
VYGGVLENFLIEFELGPCFSGKKIYNHFEQLHANNQNCFYGLLEFGIKASESHNSSILEYSRGNIVRMSVYFVASNKFVFGYFLWSHVSFVGQVLHLGVFVVYQFGGVLAKVLWVYWFIWV